MSFSFLAFSLMEEIKLISPFLFTLIFMVTFFFFIFTKTWKPKVPTPRLPPGPRKLPFIGNLLQLTGGMPHHILKDLAVTHGPIMHLKLGEISTIVISSPETAKEALKTNDLALANRPQLVASKIMSYNSTSIVFSPYGPYWRQLRKICMVELFTAKRVQSFRSIREDEVGNLIERIFSVASRDTSNTTKINLSHMVFKLTNDITSRVAFGNKCKDGDEFIVEVTKALHLASGFDLPDLFPSFKFLHPISRMKSALEEIHRKVDRILDNIIDDHRNDVRSGKEDDLVDVLLKLQQNGSLEVPMTINNIKAVIFDIFTAGSETSSTVVEWAMSEMIKNPRVMQKAQAEVRDLFKGKTKIEETDIQHLNYLKMVIKETLRLHPPVPLLVPREARENCEINGYDIPIQTKVMINAFAIGRDPNYWSNAECFYPERFLESSIDFRGGNFEYIPFGAGRRICPGISFGIINVELPLANLLYHFDWKPADGSKPEELDMTESFGGVVNKKNGLYLTAIPYVKTDAVCTPSVP